jgi:NAD(P)-dependent dehydrogenase (short-subunit alcohol dehydrogenase family)
MAPICAAILNGSVVGSKGLPANSVYAATKAAVRSFALTWTTDLKQRKIRVNVVSPGPIETEGLNQLLGSNEGGKGTPRIDCLLRTTRPHRAAGRDCQRGSVSGKR